MSFLGVQTLVYYNPFGAILYFTAGEDIVAICGASAPFNIVGVDSVGPVYSWTISGNHADPGDIFDPANLPIVTKIAYNTGMGAGQFTVTGAANAGPNTVLTVFEAIPPSATGNGNLWPILVTLTATVVGDLTGHTIEWEQIDGDPVSWITPLNQLSVTYSYGTFTDRTFRFWIDRYTVLAQYDDVVVYGTPTSRTQWPAGTMADEFEGFVSTSNQFYPYFMPETGPNIETSTNCRAPSIYLIPLDSMTPGFPLGSNGSFVGIGTTPIISWYRLVWTPPKCDADRVLQYTIQYDDPLLGWTDVVAVPNPDPTTNSFIVPSGNTYRIVAIYSAIDRYGVGFHYDNLDRTEEITYGPLQHVYSAGKYALPSPTPANSNSATSVTYGPLGMLDQQPSISDYYVQDWRRLEKHCADIPELCEDEHNGPYGMLQDVVDITDYNVLERYRLEKHCADIPELCEDEHNGPYGMLQDVPSITNFEVIGGASIGG